MVKLKPHQQKAVDDLHDGAILCGGTGVGKSITAVAYFYEKVCGGVIGDRESIRRPRDIYVITTAKKRDHLDWDAEAIKFGISTERELSTAGIQLTVDSWNNINKYAEVENAFFIFDEQRLVGSGAWVKGFLQIAPNNKWIMLSATPGDNWLDYIPVFLANGFYRNRTEFKREHVVYKPFSKFPKVDHYVGEAKLRRLKAKLLVDMPYERHTVRHLHMVDVEHDQTLFKKVVKDRWHVFEDRPIRGTSELFAAMRKVANSHVSRLEKIQGLLWTHPRVIVFYNFDYELEMLRELGTSFKPRSSTSTPTSTSSESSESPTTSTRSSQTESGSTTQSTQTTEGDEWNTEADGSSVRFRKSAGSASSTSSPSEGFSGTSEETSSLYEPSRMESLDDSSSESTATTKSATSRRKTTTSGSMDSSQRASESIPDFAIAEWNGHKHEPIPDTDRWVYLVQYAAGSEGWNCTSTDAVAFYSLTYSYKQFHQAQGRIDRLNTPFVNLHYYILMSTSLIDRLIWKALSMKKNFNESDYSD